MTFDISVQELEMMMKNGEDFFLLDVREICEKEDADIGGELIPLGKLAANLDKIDMDKLTIVYCHLGIRSSNAVMYMRSQGFDKVFNLAGGINRWIEEINPSVACGD